MPYTSDQQTLITAATKKVTEAQKALTSAQNVVNARYKIMSDKYQAGGLSPNDCYDNKQPTLEAQLGFGTMSKGNCKFFCGTCDDAVDAFNAAYADWKNAISTYLIPAQTALTQANTDLQNLLNSIKQEVQNDPAYLLQLQQLALQAKLATKKYWFWGVVVVVIGIAVFLFFRWRKGKVI